VGPESLKPLRFSKTVEAAARASARPLVSSSVGGRPSAQVPQALAAASEAPAPARRGPGPQAASESLEGDPSLVALTREWLLELKVMGRSPRTIKWYTQKLDWYRRTGQAQQLSQLTAFELKRYLGELRDRGLADNTIHAFFEVLKAFANWASREGYAVDPALLRVRAPQVAQKEVETYSAQQQAAILEAAPKGWSSLSVQILLGTGMRLSELCGLEVEDFEDDEEQAFLKIQKGKGAKFRRVPVSSRLRRELIRYLNRQRPDSTSSQLLLRSDGRPVRLVTVCDLFRRIRVKVGFGVRAHRFRHTFATEYLRAGGEIERLRRILGHTTYVMVMRYVHLDKTDLGRDFDGLSPF
jgi:integrase/recombinase XerD